MDLAIFHTNSPLFRPWLKFLVKVLYWFKLYLMPSKHFRWTVYMLNFDIKINLDEFFFGHCCLHAIYQPRGRTELIPKPLGLSARGLLISSVHPLSWSMSGSHDLKSRLKSLNNMNFDSGLLVLQIYSTNHVYLHRPNAFGFWQMRLHLCYKHSNAFRTFLNWLKNSKCVWHEPKLHISRLPLFANFDLWSVSVWWA